MRAGAFQSLTTASASHITRLARFSLFRKHVQMACDASSVAGHQHTRCGHAVLSPTASLKFGLCRTQTVNVCLGACDGAVVLDCEAASPSVEVRLKGIRAANGSISSFSFWRHSLSFSHHLDTTYDDPQEFPVFPANVAH